jgi:hypothetical protein
MADQGELEESLNNEINHYEKLLELFKNLVNLVPHIQERKQEAEVKLELAKNVPDDVIEEISPGLINIEKSEEKLLDDKISHFGTAANLIMDYFPISTGSASAYQEIVFDIPNYDMDIYSNIDPIKKGFVILAEDKSRKTETPKLLSNIYPDLGDMYVEARNSVDKAKGRIINVNQAVMDLRDVLQQIWGALGQKAVESNPEKWHGIQNKGFKKHNHRAIVADCLTDNSLDRDKLLILLGNMYKLFTDLSATDLGKNPLSNDIDRLDILHNRWIIQIDDLVSIVD